MKYKIGDRVKILPCITDAGVSRKEIGYISKVVRITGSGSLDIESSREFRYHWHVAPYMIKPYNSIGTQLLFPFMEED